LQETECVEDCPSGYYENKEKMVAFLKAGDKNWNIFTYKFYKKHINKD
jgi:hypothetical protein